MTSRLMIAAVLTLALDALVRAAPASAQPRQAVAVMPLVPQRVPAEITSILDELLVTEVYSRSGFKVIGASDINSMLGLERMKSALGCDDVSCAAEIGGALGVDMLLSGTVARLGNELFITLKLIDIAKSELKERVSVRIPDRETEYAAGIARSLAQLLRLEGATAAVAKALPPTEIASSAPPAPRASAATAPPASAEQARQVSMATEPPAVTDQVPEKPAAVVRALNNLQVTFGWRSVWMRAAEPDRVRSAIVIDLGQEDRELFFEDLADPGYKFYGAVIEYRRAYLGVLATRVRMLAGSSTFLVSFEPSDIAASGFSLGAGLYEEIFWRLVEFNTPLAVSNGALEIYAAAGGEAMLKAPDNVPQIASLAGAVGARLLWFTAELQVAKPLGTHGYAFSVGDFADRPWGLPPGYEVEYEYEGPVVGVNAGVSLAF